jgi:prepilin-type N-terminal cleavage/methylation domain-containing protein
VNQSAKRPVSALRSRDGFTLVEVMIAAIVLVLAITSAITTLQRGFQALDTARNTTFASQVMQSEMERLRLKSWAQIQAVQDSNDTAVTVNGVTGMAGSFRCTRTIRDLKTDMKEVTLVAVWNGYDGRPHTLRYITRYGKSGLYDYFYTAH